MKITVNNEICSNWGDVFHSLDWSTQRKAGNGDHAYITYHEATKCKDIPRQYTMYNWFSGDEQATTPTLDGDGRYYNEALSRAYCIAQIVRQIDEDLRKMGATLG